MANNGQGNITLSCPDCGNKIELSYRELLARREAHCACGAGYRFGLFALSRLRNALSDMERAQRNLERAERDILKGADTILKREA